MTPTFVAEVPPLDALRACAALYPLSGVMTADGAITYAAVVADADARIEEARRRGRFEGYEQRACDAEIEASAPRELREWSPDSVLRFRWNPTFDRFEWCNRGEDDWKVAHNAACVTHAKPLSDLRVSPYVQQRNQKHDAIVRAVSAAYQRLGGMPISFDSPAARVWVEAIAPLIDRERPALSEIPERALLDELARRPGWWESSVVQRGPMTVHYSTEAVSDDRPRYVALLKVPKPPTDNIIVGDAP